MALCRRPPIMPWTKNFDIDVTLDKAMRLFWSRGYDATSMTDLVRNMGINRGSLYDTFGDKRSLFIAALHRYDDKCRKSRLAALERELCPIAAIQGLFDHWIDLILDDPTRAGCFLTNTALELSTHDCEIENIVAQSQKETEQFFYRLIKTGQRSGDIPHALDARQTARVLLAELVGLLVLARSRPERALLRSIANGATRRLR